MDLKKQSWKRTLMYTVSVCMYLSMKWEKIGSFGVLYEEIVSAIKHFLT